MQTQTTVPRIELFVQVSVTLVDKKQSNKIFKKINQYFRF